MFTREELQDIRERARAGQDAVNNERWRLAFVDLEFAADRLDAMIARSTEVANCDEVPELI